MTPSIDNLAAAWASLDRLLDDLTEDDWKLPTGCPGWSVQDHVAHLVDYEVRALGLPAPEADVADGAPHIKNDLGTMNERGVEARRALLGAEVLAELRAITPARLEQLRSLTDDDLAREIDLPVGRGTVADMLTLRVMDTWSHEQDIRRAVRRPGHETGPVVDQAIDYFCRFVPMVVAKRARTPEGVTVAFELDGRPRFAVAVEGGRGSLLAAFDGEAAVALRMPVTVFDGLVCGRADVGVDDVQITGDDALARRIVAALAFMP